ncbi:MAG TPA: carboxypeptidase-like regulatory domain-containing protein, partial [Polyangia bacterium]
IDESGQPLADAQIEAEPEAGFSGFRAGQPRPRAFSDGRGQFRFATMPAGRYALRARAPSGAEAVVRGIEAGGAPATMLARSPGSLEGVLSGFGERPDVRVESVSTGERIGAELRGDARFSATGLPPGKYLVRVVSGSNTQTHEVTIASGERQHLTLSRAATALAAPSTRSQP